MAGYAGMMKQMKKIERDMAKTQAEIEARAFSAESAGGKVTVKALGTKEITEITIDPTLFAGDEQEMIADLVRLAVNTVIKEIEEVSDKELAKVTGGMNLPGLF
jgi:hypothetical protein